MVRTWNLESELCLNPGFTPWAIYQFFLWFNFLIYKMEIRITPVVKIKWIGDSKGLQ